LRSSCASADPALTPAAATSNATTSLLPNKTNLLRFPAQAESLIAQTVSSEIPQASRFGVSDRANCGAIKISFFDLPHVFFEHPI
jgi:hypothetical protein